VPHETGLLSHQFPTLFTDLTPDTETLQETIMIVDHHVVLLLDPEAVEGSEVHPEEDIPVETSTVREMILPTGEIPMLHPK